MSQYPISEPFSGLKSSMNSGGPPCPVQEKPASIIQTAFGRLDNTQERLMKAVSTLLAKIQPVMRNEPPSPVNKLAKDQSVSPVPIAQRLDELNCTLENLSEQITEASQRIEL